LPKRSARLIKPPAASEGDKSNSEDSQEPIAIRNRSKSRTYSKPAKKATPKTIKEVSCEKEEEKEVDFEDLQVKDCDEHDSPVGIGHQCHGREFQTDYDKACDKL